MQHTWVPSTLGHGDVMCSRCFVTNLEAAALGISEKCDVPLTAANENVTTPQDQIDRDMLDEIDEDEEYDESEECGRWNNGHLTSQCRLAGTEWCDWSCPIGC